MTDKADDGQKDAKWEDDRTELITNASAKVQVIAELMYCKKC